MTLICEDCGVEFEVTTEGFDTFVAIDPADQVHLDEHDWSAR